MHGWETGASGRVETKKKKKRKTEKKKKLISKHPVRQSDRTCLVKRTCVISNMVYWIRKILYPEVRGVGQLRASTHQRALAVVAYC